jgi:hypothetical protein
LGLFSNYFTPRSEAPACPKEKGNWIEWLAVSAALTLVWLSLIPETRGDAL